MARLPRVIITAYMVGRFRCRLFFDRDGLPFAASHVACAAATFTLPRRVARQAASTRFSSIFGQTRIFTITVGGFIAQMISLFSVMIYGIGQEDA